jgi:hypothetical protein
MESVSTRQRDINNTRARRALASSLMAGPPAQAKRCSFTKVRKEQMTRKLLVAAWVVLCVAMIGSAAYAGSVGRFKDDGNGGCVFDATDDGFDQCVPAGVLPAGRFKDDGNGGCQFDATDSGPDQCVPPPATPTIRATINRAAETTSTPQPRR